MAEIGDKYIIEIASKADANFGLIKHLYSIKGIKSMLFDDIGLSKLEKLKDVYDAKDGAKADAKREEFSTHDELVLISAERYAMGRQTYIVQVVANYIRARVNGMSDWCLSVLKNDYEDKQKEAKRLNSDRVFGMDCDKREWDALYAAVVQELRRRQSETNGGTK